MLIVQGEQAVHRPEQQSFSHKRSEATRSLCEANPKYVFSSIHAGIEVRTLRGSAFRVGLCNVSGTATKASTYDIPPLASPR